MNTDIKPEPTGEETIVPAEIDLAEFEMAELFTGSDGEANDWLDFVEPPILIVDTDPERVLARLQEMMAYAFEGIGEEKKEEKRLGLALQHLDIEQRHALRLLLLYEEPAELTAHLERCLADPAYGYGERGDNGRTIAQAMAAISGGDPSGSNPSGRSLAGVVAEWLAAHREFQQAVLAGVPFNFLSLYHYADVDNFIPLLQRVGAASLADGRGAASRAESRGDETWRLGVEGQGKFRDFSGPLVQSWPQICDTHVAWLDEDNEAWLNELKRKATRLPDSILRAARADRLRKETDRVEVNGNKIVLITERGEEAWPQTVVFTNAEGVGQLALSRLSGHNFYEASWEGGLHTRYFELSSTTRQKIPFEHIELAVMLAETLAGEAGLHTEPVTDSQVEAAYLRRMKAAAATIGPPPAVALSLAIDGQPAAVYQVGQVVVTVLHGGNDLAYITIAGNPKDEAVLLQRNEPRGQIVAVPVARGRPRRGSALMTIPLAELELQDPGWRRALYAWGAWLAWVLYANTR